MLTEVSFLQQKNEIKVGKFGSKIVPFPKGYIRPRLRSNKMTRITGHKEENY
jgi:hypothetical protein